MARDILKAQEKYRAKFYGRPDNRAAYLFKFSEIEQIRQAASCKGEAAITGLEAGFWVGYQYAKREAREKNRRAQQ